MARKARVSAALLRIMAHDVRHAWTLEGLQAGLARDGTAANFSSVFRATERLTADGSIHKLPDAEGRARFELASAHHDHLHCTCCDDLIPIPCVIPAPAFARIEATNRVKISGHRVILIGLCPSCQTAANRRPR